MKEINTQEPVGKEKSIKVAVFLLFFASGVTGLVYEVVWTRLLIYVFGATLFAVSTVLSAFMGGLALGSYLFGKYADRQRNNLRLYGILEIGIGLSALLLPFLLSLLHPLYRISYQYFNASFIVLSLVRFVLTFIVLLIPTTLMGATLPVLSRFMVRRKDSLGLNVGFLYSLNTLGAVLGCFLTGFLLIAVLGVRGSTILAVVLNCFIGLISLVLAKGKDRPKEDVIPKEQAPDERAFANEAQRKQARKIVHGVLWCYAISGFIALSYQVVWNRALVFSFEIMKNTTYSFTAILTVFLIGLSVGAPAFPVRLCGTSCFDKLVGWGFERIYKNRRSDFSPHFFNGHGISCCHKAVRGSHKLRGFRSGAALFPEHGWGYCGGVRCRIYPYPLPWRGCHYIPPGNR